MCQIKLAAILVMPLAFLCSIATAQERQPGSPAKPSAATQLKPQTQLTPSVKTQPPQQVAGPHVSNVRPAQKMPTIAGTGADPPPTACPTPIASTASSNSSSSNSSTVQKPQPDSFIKSAPVNLAQPGNLALTPEAAPSTTDSPVEAAYVRPVPTQRAPTIAPELKPFRSWAIGFRASTLGTGIEFATPL